MTSIRRKISGGFYAFAAIVALLTTLGYVDLRHLAQRIASGTVISDFVGAVLEHRRGIAPLHLGEQELAAVALHPGPHGARIACALDEIACPVAGHFPSQHLGGTLVDRDPLREPPAPIPPRLRGRRRSCAWRRAPMRVLRRSPRGWA